MLYIFAGAWYPGIGIYHIVSHVQAFTLVCVFFTVSFFFLPGAININPFRTAVPFWGQTSLISSSLSPKRDCGSKGVNSNGGPHTASGWVGAWVDDCIAALECVATKT